MTEQKTPIVIKGVYTGLVRYSRFHELLVKFKFFRWYWKKFHCKNGFHLFDEVYSPITEQEEVEHGMTGHYINCDVCNLEICVQQVNLTYVDKEVLLKNMSTTARIQLDREERKAGK